jgi:hypothetical protein
MAAMTQEGCSFAVVLVGASPCTFLSYHTRHRSWTCLRLCAWLIVRHMDQRRMHATVCGDNHYIVKSKLGDRV